MTPWIPLACMVLAGLGQPAQESSTKELRAALDVLRDGQPGEAAFEAALPRLPELLASRSSVFVEGAAYLAGIHGRSECADALIDALRHENERPPDRSASTTRCILDALIQLDVAAPAEVLLARPDPELATMLYLALSCEPDPERAATSLVRFVALGWCADRPYWAAAVELAVARDPRIVAHAFAADWELQVGVRDPRSADEVPDTLGGGRWTVSHAMWPPRVQYELKLPDSGAPLDRIEYTRHEHDRSGPQPSRLFPHERIAWRARILRELAPGSPALDLPAATAYVETFDRASLERAVREHVARARSLLATAAEELERSKLLPDAAAATAALRFSVELVDLRSDRSTPLPPIEGIDGTIVVAR